MLDACPAVTCRHSGRGAVSSLYRGVNPGLAGREPRHARHLVPPWQPCTAGRPGHSALEPRRAIPGGPAPRRAQDHGPGARRRAQPSIARRRPEGSPESGARGAAQQRAEHRVAELVLLQDVGLGEPCLLSGVQATGGIVRFELLHGLARRRQDRDTWTHGGRHAAREHKEPQHQAGQGAPRLSALSRSVARASTPATSTQGAAWRAPPASRPGPRTPLGRPWRLCPIVLHALHGSCPSVPGVPSAGACRVRQPALAHTTEHRHVEARKRVMFRDPMFGCDLQNPTVRQRPPACRSRKCQRTASACFCPVLQRTIIP